MGIGFQRRDIGDYMRRWILSLPFGLMVRVHHIQRADADDELHDHPFGFVSLVLRGWYVEELPAEHRMQSAMPGGLRTYTTRRPGSIARRRSHVAHRISRVSEGGVWTLVFARRGERQWGFYTANGWVPWTEFVTRKPGKIVNHGGAA